MLAQLAVRDAQAARQHLAERAEQIFQPWRRQSRRGDAKHPGKRIEELAAAQRLVIDHVVGAGRNTQRRDDRGGGVLVRDQRGIGVGDARDRRPAAPDVTDQVAGEPGIGAIEHREPQHHAGAPAAGEALRRPFGVRDRAIVAHRRDRRALVDPLVAAIGIDRGERFLDEPRGAGRHRRVHQICRREAADAVVLGPGARQESAIARGHMGGEIDDNVMPGHRFADGVGGEQVDLDRGRTGADKLGVRLWPAHDSGHAVPRADQQRQCSAPDHAGRAGEKNPHYRAPTRATLAGLTHRAGGWFGVAGAG